MDDPYWSQIGEGHHIDLDAIKSLGFQLLCIFEASKGLLDQFDAAEAEAVELAVLDAEAGEDKAQPETPNDSLLLLHDELITSEAAKIMLSLAVTLRTYDDYMKHGPDADNYHEHVAEKGGNNYVGGTDDQQRFNYRDACNKIIHALKINPTTEKYERVYGEGTRDLEILTGVVELTGIYQGNRWNATIHIRELVETILDVIGFGYASTDTDGAT